MSEEELIVEENPAGDLVQFLEDEMYRFNVQATGLRDGRLLASFVHDRHGRLAGGVFGWTWGGCLEVRYLWVREDRRGQGLGSRLLALAEREALARGCRQALLETHSFQAPAFYLKRGYAVYATLEDYPEGHKKHFMRKRLAGG